MQLQWTLLSHTHGFHSLFFTLVAVWSPGAFCMRPDAAAFFKTLITVLALWAVGSQESGILVVM